MSPSKPSPPAGNADNDSRVYCSLEQLLALKQQASYIKFDARYRPAGLLAGRHRSRLRGRGMNFEELRGYRSGDSVRDIDWKASAHSRQKLVKVFTEETDRPTVLLVDQRRSLFFGSRERTKSVTAAEVAATLAWMVLDSGDRLGGVVFNNEEQTFLRPTRSSLGAMVATSTSRACRSPGWRCALGAVAIRIRPMITAATRTATMIAANIFRFESIAFIVERP